MYKGKFSTGLKWAKRKLASGFTSYTEAASRSITRIKNWLPTNVEVNTLVIADGNMMRARSRKIARENPWGRGAIDSFVSNAIGTGITPRSAHPDPAMRSAIDAAFKRWTLEADANGMQDFYGLQSTACRSIRTDGEVFARLRYRRPSDNMHVPLQVQLIEADHVPYDRNEFFGESQGFVRAGIKFNAIGQRVSYFMYRDHPGSNFVKDGVLYEIPAEQVVHCYEVRRPQMYRGEPWFTPAIIMLYDVKQLVDAALMRQKVSNLLSVWVKRATSGSQMLNEKDNKDGTGTAGFAPGSVNYLDAGEEPAFMEPKEPGIGFKEFLNAMLRAVARALGITFEQLTGDLSGVNYSSIRAGLLEFRRWCEAFQYQVIVFQFCMPIWKAWVEQAVLAGTLGEAAIAQYAANPQAFLEVSWHTQGWPWVDPLKDGLAAQQAVRDGFTSRTRVVAETGESAEDIDREQQADNTRADAADLMYDSDGRQAPGGGQAQADALAASEQQANQQQNIDKSALMKELVIQ